MQYSRVINPTTQSITFNILSNSWFIAASNSSSAFLGVGLEESVPSMKAMAEGSYPDK